MRRAQLVFVRVPAKDTARVKDFYGALFGVDLVGYEHEDHTSYYAPIDEGVDLVVNTEGHGDDDIVSFFHVDDLEGSIRELEGKGGKVKWGPVELGEDGRGRVGHAATLEDPEGRVVGIIQLDESAHNHFQVAGARQEIPRERQRAHEQALQRA